MVTIFQCSGCHVRSSTTNAAPGVIVTCPRCGTKTQVAWPLVVPPPIPVRVNQGIGQPLTHGSKKAQIVVLVIACLAATVPITWFGISFLSRLSARATSVARHVTSQLSELASKDVDVEKPEASKAAEPQKLPEPQVPPAVQENIVSVPAIPIRKDPLPIKVNHFEITEGGFLQDGFSIVCTSETPIVVKRVTYNGSYVPKQIGIFMSVRMYLDEKARLPVTLEIGEGVGFGWHFANPRSENSYYRDIIY